LDKKCLQFDRNFDVAGPAKDCELAGHSNSVLKICAIVPSMLKPNLVIENSTQNELILAALSRIEEKLESLELRMMKLETRLILSK
jgi:hypothetical protein